MSAPTNGITVGSAPPTPLHPLNTYAPSLATLAQLGSLTPCSACARLLNAAHAHGHQCGIPSLREPSEAAS